MDATDLGPLFVRPEDPHYLWIAGTIVAAGCLFAAVVGLLRGRASIAAASVGLVTAPVFAYGIGYVLLLEESKGIAFCGSCHETMSPIVEALATDEESLASIHWQKGAVNHAEACYQCHSGYGIWGGAAAKRAGFRHMWATLTKSYEFPLEPRGAFDVNSCLACHAETKAFRDAEDHLDLELQEAMLTGEIGCTGDCHPAAHPESALNGAQAASAEAAR